MRLKWKLVEGSQASEPPSLEVNHGSYYVRRNIQRVGKEDEEGNVTFYWQYEEVKLTEAEYEMYLADIESPSTESIMQVVNDLQASQEMADIVTEENMETIMQTLSDIEAEILM